MTFTIPPGNKVAGESGFVSDINDAYAALAAVAGINVLNAAYAGGADPTGATDSTAAINAALTTASAGDVVCLPPGTYTVSSPLTVPPGVRLAGPGLYINVQTTIGSRAGAIIAPSGSFSGTEVIYVPDETAGGWSGAAQNSAITGITIDCTSSPASVDAIRVYGAVDGLVISDVNIVRPTGWGLNVLPDGSNFADLLKVFRTIINFNGTGGISLSHCPDSTFTDVYVLGGTSGGDCWAITPGGNTHLIGCRAENAGGNGFNLNGNGGYGQVTLTGCSSNLVGKNGILINGTGAVIVTGGYHNGAGQSGTGYAAIAVESQLYPVIINGVNTTCALNGSSVNGPTYGLAVTSSSKYVSAARSLLWGATAAAYDDGSNTDCFYGRDNLLITGTQSAPAPNVEQQQPQFDWTATDLGYAAETYEAWLTSDVTTRLITAGTLNLIGVRVRQPRTVSTIRLQLIGNGATLTTGENLVGLYNSAGQLVGYSADQTTAWGSGASKFVNATLTAESTGSLDLQPGLYWIAILGNGTTMPSFNSNTNSSSTFANGNLTAATARYATNGSALTALPTSFTPSSSTLTQITWWAALY